MRELSAFPIARKWPATQPDRLQLYSLPTPNGVKVSIMLEETGLPYEPHLVSFERNDQMSPEFLSLNPNNKIPAIIDPNGPDGRPLPLFESGAILIYLADKTGQLIPEDAAGRVGGARWTPSLRGAGLPMELSSTQRQARTVTQARATVFSASSARVRFLGVFAKGAELDRRLDIEQRNVLVLQAFEQPG